MKELILLFVICVLITAIFTSLVIWLLFKIADWVRRKRKTKVISDLRWLLLGEEGK